MPTPSQTLVKKPVARPSKVKFEKRRTDVKKRLREEEEGDFRWEIYRTQLEAERALDAAADAREAAEDEGAVPSQH
jgi:hypothetical protein